MPQPNTVEIVEVCRVAPHHHDPLPAPSPKSLPLTFFDLRWLRLPPTRILFFYQIPTPNTSSSSSSTTTTATSPSSTSISFFFDSILPKLKHSLSLTLQHFLPLAGSLTWPPNSTEPVLFFAQQNDSVSLSVAQSSADSHHVASLTSDHGDRHDQLTYAEAKAWLPLIPNLVVTEERASILAIQVTLFPNCGYFSIATTNHHAVLDGQSILYSFMKSWAYTCRSLSGGHVSLPSELKPFYDRTSLMEDPTMAKLRALYLNQWLDLEGPNNRSLLHWGAKVKPDHHTVRGTFQLPRVQIEKLRRLILANDNNVVDGCPVHVSTFSLTCAYALVCLVKAEAEELNDNNIELSFPVDCRSRLEPPLPPTYFGNCLASKHLVLDKQVLLGKQGFGESVLAISEATKSLEKGFLNEAESWVSMLAKAVIGKSNSTSKSYPVSSTPRFEVYGTDFGWGRPKKVDVMSRGINLLDSKNGDGGVEIGLALKKHHMEAFASFFAQGVVPNSKL